MNRRKWVRIIRSVLFWRQRSSGGQNVKLSEEPSEGRGEFKGRESNKTKWLTKQCRNRANGGSNQSSET